MSYETVRDVLERARAFHRELADYYQQLSDTSNKERVRLVLDYMSRHEEYLDQCLADYEKGADKGIMETWYKFTPPGSMSECLDGLALEPNMTVAEVIGVTMRMDKCLVELYKGMAERAVSDEVRHVFTELLAMEEKEEHQRVRDLIEMEDL